MPWGLRKEYQNTFDTGNSSFRCSLEPLLLHELLMAFGSVAKLGLRAVPVSLDGMRWPALFVLCAAERPLRAHLLDPNATAFEYPKLRDRVGELAKESEGYAAQVKGPVMHRAELWLQRKSSYEDAVQVLKKGMEVEGQLLHRLGSELKANHTKRLKAIQEHLESNGSNSSNTSKASP